MLILQKFVIASSSLFDNTLMTRLTTIATTSSDCY